MAILVRALAPNDSVVGLILLTAFILVATCRYSNPYQMMWMGSYFSFCVVPFVSLYLLGEPTVSDAMLACSVYSIAFIVMTDELSGFPLSNSRYGGGHLFLIIAIGFLIVTPFISNGAGYYLLATLPILVAAFAISIMRSSAIRVITYFILLFLCLAAFSLISWSGGGRLIIAGALALAFLLTSYSTGITIGRSGVIALMSLGSIAGTFVRFTDLGINTLLDAVKSDSSFFVIIKLQDILYTTDKFRNEFSGIVDQFVLFFLIGMPRALWPEKPNGFGYAYTVDNLDQGRIDSGYSIAATFVGEHVYYLGAPLWHLSMIVTLLLMWLLIKVSWHDRVFGGLVAIGVLIYLPTFFWGGMASFSARFLIGLPLLVCVGLASRIWTTPSSGGREARSSSAAAAGRPWDD